MSNFRIIYTRPDGGGLSIIIPAENVSEIDAAKSVPNGVEYQVVDVADIPTDRTFRNAWELADGDVAVNFSKAQALTKDRLRSERKPLMEAQDIAFQRALESGADTSAIVAEKNRLRDITKLVDTATTLDELKGLSCQ